MKTHRDGGTFCLLRALFLLCSTFLALLAIPGNAAPAKKISLEDILAAFDSQPVDQARIDRVRQITLMPIPAQSDDAQTLIRHYWQRANAYEELGQVQPQIADLRKVVELGGGNDPGQAWRALSHAEFLGGNINTAIAARLKAMSATPANMRGRLLGDHTALADLYRRVGDFVRARQHVRDAETLLLALRTTRGWNDNQYSWQTGVEDALGRIELASGRYVEAEARFRKAIEWHDREMQVSEQQRANGQDTRPLFRQESRRDALENWLSQSLWKQGRLYEAEIHARNAAYQSLRRAGEDSIRASTNTQQLISILAEQDKLEAALQLVERIGRSLERQKLPASAFFVARNQRLRANTLAALSRWQEAISVYEANRQALAAEAPELLSTLGGPTLGWLRALTALQRHEEAIAMGQAMLSQYSEQLGAQAYETQEARGYLAVALARAGQQQAAVRHFREAFAILLPAATQADRSTRRFGRLSFLIETYLSLLAEMRQQLGHTPAAEQLAGEAFTLADALRGQSVQQAMAASAARAAVGSPELAALVRQAQDARQERDALNTILADLMSRRADQVPPGIIAEMRQRVARLEKTLQVSDAEIRRRFPEYAELITPRPSSLAAIRSALRPGEALLSILASDEQTYLWAIPAQGESAFAVVPVGRKPLNQAVSRLRAALDPGDVELAKLPAFDGATAYRLYQQLLAPVRSGWAGANHLIVAAGGSLGRLPLSVLLSAPPPAGKNPLAFADYAEWPWLLKEVAISQLPAAGALPTLRGMKPGAHERLALAAFGDPDFGGKSRSTVQTRGFRSSLKHRSTNEPALADYSRIPPLPDTREEVLALAKTLHADNARDLFLGAQASRQTVLHTRLDNRRVVAFATHGLLAGEYPGVDQPALALANPGDGQHGLLTLDDILGLKLDADWIVLSACNTSAGEGQGSEALSGLGRGFFYAGARALLVTHWPVETVSAKQLVIGVFQSLADQPTLTRAQALRQSMLKVMQGQGEEGGFRFSYAHPLFWAPYALVGDGGQ